MTAAAIAKPVSTALTPLTTGRGAAIAGAGRTGAEAARGAAAPAEVGGRGGGGAPACPAVGGRGGAGAPTAGGGGTTPAALVAAWPEGGAPGGKVGNLIVAVGLGGKLMRTV